MEIENTESKSAVQQNEQHEQQQEHHEEERAGSALEAAEEALGITGSDDGKEGDSGAKEDETTETGEATEEDGDQAQDNDDDDTVEDDETIEPEGLSERASQRFKALVEKRNEFEQKFLEANERIDAIKSAMTESMATPDDMARFLEVTRLSRSESIEDKRKALAELDRQRNELALSIGDIKSSTSALDVFPDLKEKVENMELDEDAALQIAQARHLQQQQQRAQQEMLMQQQQQTSVEMAAQQAIEQVASMAEEWSKSDPDYKAKEEILLPQMNQIRETLPPEQWAAAVKLAYESVSKAFSTRKPPMQPSPISKTGVSGGDKGSPKTALEAAEAALGEL